MARRRNSKKISVITIHVDPLKVATGHQPHASGAGVHKDKRHRRLRTRSAASTSAILDSQ
jgi:hypothetical protein